MGKALEQTDLCKQRVRWNFILRILLILLKRYPISSANYFSRNTMHFDYKKFRKEENVDKIAVLIPCYNESRTIQKVVEDFTAVLPEATIYVYDNNSIDGTAEIAKQAGAVVRYEKRQGKGNVIRSMFRDVDAECYLMIDGDDTYPAEHARDLVDQVLLHGSDMVVGDRLSSTYFTENKRLFHNSGNTIVRSLVNWIFNGNVMDIMTGYRAFSPLFVKTFPVLSKGFEIETEMTIHALDKNMAISSCPVLYRDRPEGSESKLNTVSDGMKVLLTILRLFKDYRPFAFFGMIAALLAFIAILMFIPIFITFFQTHLVPKIPTLIVAGFIGLSAVLSMSIGLILDTMVKDSRKNFEFQLNLFSHLLKKDRE